LRALLIRMLNPDEQVRRWTLARFELFMESTRRAELRPLMKELQAAAVKSATLIIEAAGFTPAPERMDELSRLLNGFVFSNLTIAPEGAYDAAGLVDRLLSAFLD
jgi:hypothetical protein